MYFTALIINLRKTCGTAKREDDEISGNFFFDSPVLFVLRTKNLPLSERPTRPKTPPPYAKTKAVDITRRSRDAYNPELIRNRRRARTRARNIIHVVRLYAPRGPTDFEGRNNSRIRFQNDREQAVGIRTRKYGKTVRSCTYPNTGQTSYVTHRSIFIRIISCVSVHFPQNWSTTHTHACVLYTYKYIYVWLVFGDKWSLRTRRVRNIRR